eukprot:PITA_28137
MDLFQNKSDHGKLPLKDKLRKIKMEKDKSSLKYLTNFTQCRDEIGSVGITIAKDDLSNLVQEEFQRNTRDGTSSKEVEEEFSLVSKEKKAKGNKYQSEEGGKNKDLLNIKCFHYHEYGHHATNFPQKKASKKDPTIVADGEALASQFELDFTLIACMANTAMESMWHLYSGASSHMTGNKDLFSYLKKKYLKQNIEFGDDGRYSVTDISIVTLQRESRSLLKFTDVMYAPGLKKDLFSVTILEECGYNVTFIKGKVFLRHITTGQVQ